MIPRGFIPLSNTGLLRIFGPQAKQFLQGQLTCNLDEITHTQTRLGAQCNPQGRIIHFFRLFYHQDSYYLLMPTSLIPIAMNALKKYAVFFKVEISDASHTLSVMGVCGEQLPIFPQLPQHIDELVFTDECIIIKLAGRFLMIGSPTQLSHLQEKFLTNNLHKLEYETWLQFNFQDNLPTIYPETSEKFLPHELLLPQLNAISFEKGCYTGQEIIARMQYRGKAKYQLQQCSVVTESIPERGADIYDATHAVGMLVDYYKTGYNTYQLQLTTTSQENDLFFDPHRQLPLIR